MSWDKLPPEIHEMIFEMLSHDSMTGVFAAVSREWQGSFERKNFERIILSRQRVKSFGDMVRGPKRKLVKHIWLRIELNTYDCGLCQEIPEKASIQEDTLAFSESITCLLMVLKSWQKPRDVYRDGVELELSVYSPSDSQHIFKHYDLKHNPYSEPSENFTISKANFNDEIHFWKNGNIHCENQDAVEKFLHAKNRVIGGGLTMCQRQIGNKEPTLPHISFPKTNVITKLLVRRQYMRFIHPDGLCQILNSLTGLESIVYEPPKWTEDHERYRFVFELALPSTLTHLSIFVDIRAENFIQATSSWDTWIFSPVGLLSEDPFAQRRLGLSLAKGSQKLEHLSASFLVDAKDVLSQYFPPTDTISHFTNTYHWERLKTIALTSELLKPTEDPAQIHSLLRAASKAARCMPLLQVMEIWNGWDSRPKLYDLDDEFALIEYDSHMEDLHDGFQGAVGYGSMFRYSVDKTAVWSSATITWQGTWRYRMASEVVTTWKETALRHGSQVLDVVYEDMVQDGTFFPASVLRHLKLKDRVLHPVSYRQFEILGAPEGSS